MTSPPLLCYERARRRAGERSRERDGEPENGAENRVESQRTGWRAGEPGERGRELENGRTRCWTWKTGDRDRDVERQMIRSSWAFCSRSSTLVRKFSLSLSLDPTLSLSGFLSILCFFFSLSFAPVVSLQAMHVVWTNLSVLSESPGLAASPCSTLISPTWASVLLYLGRACECVCSSKTGASVSHCSEQAWICDVMFIWSANFMCCW